MKTIIIILGLLYLAYYTLMGIIGLYLLIIKNPAMEKEVEKSNNVTVAVIHSVLQIIGFVYLIYYVITSYF